MTEPKPERYDVIDFLEVEEDVIAYLNAALEDGHPEVIAHAIGKIARMRGMTISAWYCTSTTEQRSLPWLAAKEHAERRHRPAVARAGLDQNRGSTLGRVDRLMSELNAVRARSSQPLKPVLKVYAICV